MKKYNTPEIDVVNLATEDIMTLSSAAEHVIGDGDGDMAL